MDEEFELELEDEFEELFEFEFDDEFDELFEFEFEDELDELFEFEFDDELDELLPAGMIWPVSPVTVCVPGKSGLATLIACATPAPRPSASAPVKITLRFMIFPFIKVESGPMAHPDEERTMVISIPREMSYLFVFRVGLSENRFALFGPML